ncbi:MAG TPA: ATP-binding protein, partial [Oceanospirillales bacterium]|nr:ATP-binding protein [Oceanospirillales bacterium]
MFVARTAELEKLTEITDRQRSSFVALYGRRRIGKTVLVRQFVKQNRLNAFEFSGRYDQSKAQIIRSFVRSIKLLFKHNNNNPITDWNAAFGLLIDYLKSLDNQTKTVVFLDELPWIDTAKSGFLAELAEFWNNFCARKQNIILIVCGSAASYMLKKVIHNKGSLHGRLTDIIPLQQFDLNASKQLLSSQGCQYSDKTIVDTYMLLGGVAKYLESLNCQLTPA